MSATRHIAAQVTLYKKGDINLDTYYKHTKTQTDKPTHFKTTYKNTLKGPKNINEKTKKELFNK